MVKKIDYLWSSGLQFKKKERKRRSKSQNHVKISFKSE
jgi:hypothetical protein